MMRVKKYVAHSLAEAIVQAKKEMGRDAFIVDSRKIKTGGFMGLFSKTMTEVTVAVDDKAARASADSRPAAEAARTGVGTAPGQAPAPAAAAQPAFTPLGAAVPATSPGTGEPGALSTLEREVQGLRAAVSKLMEQSSADLVGELKGYGRQVYDTLLSIGVDEPTALALSRPITAEGPEGQEMFRRELGRLLGPGAPIAVKPGYRRIVALVGPTGVGKTTTLAKLAARFSLEQGLKLGLITSDTFRIAAIEQLRTYADILGVPLYTVDTPAQVAEALRETVDCDLVLIDTSGRSHRDTAKMHELKELLAVVRPDETHLVMALTTNPKDAAEQLDAYLPMGVNRLTFTKLDEATSPGLMVNVAVRSNQPLSYVTNGQSVPEDITPADRVDLTKILLGA